MYGDLGYILRTVVAAEEFGVYAMRFGADAAVVPLVEPFRVGHEARTCTGVAHNAMNTESVRASLAAVQ